MYRKSLFPIPENSKRCAAVDKVWAARWRKKLTLAPRRAGAKSVSDLRWARNSVGESARVVRAEIRRKVAEK